MLSEDKPTTLLFRRDAPSSVRTVSTAFKGNLRERSAFYTFGLPLPSKLLKYRVFDLQTLEKLGLELLS